MSESSESIKLSEMFSDMFSTLSARMMKLNLMAYSRRHGWLQFG